MVERGGNDCLRPFKCLLLMPFETRFDMVAEELHACINEICKSKLGPFGQPVPLIERLDWVTSSGVIQSEIWEKIAAADMVFCDTTGYNPNVMFEAGVAAAWKNMAQVVFIRDHFFKQQSPFDIAPIRYTEYQLTSDGLPAFRKKVKDLMTAALMQFPSEGGHRSPISFPCSIHFDGNHDDLRIYTPPLAHRRVVQGALEFGSLSFYPQSWASLGNEQVLNCDIAFDAKFRYQQASTSWVGIALRSQSFWANYSHLLYLKVDGSIVVTQPDESKPNLYSDVQLRKPRRIDPQAFHHFHMRFSESTLRVQIDDFSRTIRVARMPKVLGAGLVRFQSAGTWMVLKNIRARRV